MVKHPDVAIVGGGIIGLTCALFLAKRGLTVSVYERGEFGKEASWAGAGILPPGNLAGAKTSIDQLRAIGSLRFQSFSDELRKLTGIDNGYLLCGGIEFLDEEEVLSLWAEEGIAFEKLSRANLRALEPAVEWVPAQPYLLPDCAQVRNPRHLEALIAGCRKLGVRLHQNSPATSIHPIPGQPEYGRCSIPGQGEVDAGRILVTAGPWSEMLIRAAARQDYGIHPVRGQIVLLRQSTRAITRVIMSGKRYLVPRADGRVLIGSTEEPEARFEKANTAEAVAGLIGFATRLVPSLATAELERCWSGLRPGTPDGLPFIGPVPGWRNLFTATGHFRAGVQLSIGTAQVVTQLFTGEPTCVPLESFALDRQPIAGVRAAFRS